MKRITYWPQFFLGITFNWGLVMAYISVSNNISAEIIVLYMSAIFWSLGYDTIYGAQDISDDEIIGLKSTSVKFKNNIKLFIGVSYLINVLLLTYLFKTDIGYNFFSVLFFFFIITLFYQIFKFNKNQPKSCLKMFKINNISGLSLLTSILLINY
jgi:4-hydroxybenzoate polyprenyltransferase